ncbi:MAG: hypothetical protein EXR12_11535 [Rhodospirillaceae bacterium]|nr:hypothetical protein [Rhodospirillaceae bacterium]
MSHTIRLNDDLGVIVLRAKRSMDIVEIQAAFAEMLQLPGFREGLSLVVDFRGSETPLSAADVRQLAEYAWRADARWGTTKWALLASADLAYGLSHIFMALTSEHQIETHVFRNLVQANGWLSLGVDVDEILVRTPD